MIYQNYLLRESVEQSRAQFHQSRRTDLIAILYEVETNNEGKRVPKANARTRSEALFEFIEIGRDEHNPGGAVDLSFAQLSDLQLFRANLSGVSLIGANLRGAGLDEANLSGTDLSRADLSSSSLFTPSSPMVILSSSSMISKARERPCSPPAARAQP